MRCKRETAPSMNLIKTLKSTTAGAWALPSQHRHTERHRNRLNKGILNKEVDGTSRKPRTMNRHESTEGQSNYARSLSPAMRNETPNQPRSANFSPEP